MAILGTMIDTAVVEPAGEYSPLPPGEYIVVVTESEVKPNSKGTGTIVKIKMQVIDGQHKGRTLYDNINITNPSAQAQSIGQSQLAAIAKACGVAKLLDTAQLHGKPIKVKVENEPDNRDPSKTRSRVSAYLWKESQVAAATAQAKSGPGPMSDEDVPF
jgi:hypothetical protein